MVDCSADAIHQANKMRLVQQLPLFAKAGQGDLIIAVLNKYPDLITTQEKEPATGKTLRDRLFEAYPTGKEKIGAFMSGDDFRKDIAAHDEGKIVTVDPSFEPSAKAVAGPYNPDGCEYKFTHPKPLPTPKPGQDNALITGKKPFIG